MRPGAMTATFIALLMLSSFAYPMQKDGVSYPDRITVNGIDLILNGLGTREATIFKVNVYVAALYLENPGSNGQAICRSEETKRLVLHFVRDVDESDITSAWAEGFMKNAGDDLAAYEDRIRTLNSWMSRMSEGDRMMFTYAPGEGLEISVRGTVMGTIEGSDFASVFLSIWLGDHPPNGGLRDGLLGLN